jgi:glycosyltransferase involved in cell wall biosynthesis
MTDVDPARVLMVSSLWPPAVLGGAELYAAALAEQLRAAGHEVGVFTLGVPGPDVIGEVPPRPYRLDEYASQPAWRRATFHARDLYRPATRRLMAEACQRFQPDVIHTHSVQGLSTLALEVPSRLGIAHVHTIHDYWLLCQRASMVKRDGTACEPRCRSCRAISANRNWLIARHPPDVVVAVSEAVAAEHRRLAWLQPRLVVIHNPIDSVPHARRDPGDPLTFGYIGQVTKTKGVATLVDAFTRTALPRARLVIAGDGALRAELQTADLPDVDVRGWVDAARKEAFFAATDCLIVPSEWKDPAPLVINEARARGIPVIGARIGGIPELVGPASRPLLFPSGNAAELSARLAAFASSPDRYRGEPDDSSGWPEHVRAIQGVYDRAASASSAGARKEW